MGVPSARPVPDRAPVSLVGVGAISAALLATELVLTRVFSVVIWYHFAFFAVSVALFGTAVSALLIHALGARVGRWPGALPSTAAAFSVATVGTGAFLVHVVPRWFDTLELDVGLTLRLAITFVVTALPFLFGGAALTLAIVAARERVHRVYAWDLVGAGLGCVLSIVVMGVAGGPGALIVCAALGVVAALAFARDVGRGWMPGVLAGTITVAAGIAHGSGGFMVVDSAKGHDAKEVGLELSRWNAHSHVAVLGNLPFLGWGMSPAYEGPIPPRKSVVIDMNALTALPGGTGDPAHDGAYLLHDLSALVYRLGPPKRVLVLGAGAGSDVLAALAAGAEHVTAVEINALIVNTVVRGAYRAFTGGLYDREDVEPVVGDARAFVRGTDQRYDRIVVSMVDTSAATAAGAYVLTENGIYTVEAFSNYLDRLTPGGILSVSSVTMPGLSVGARLTGLARAALREIGADPARGIAVVQTPWMRLDQARLNTVLIKPDGFSETEINQLAVAAKLAQFTPVVFPGRFFSPNTPEDAAIHTIATEPDDAELDAWYDSLPIDIAPPTDDRPFFFYQNRLEHFGLALGVTGQGHPFGNGLVFLVRVLLVSLAMVAVCLVLPLAWLGRERRVARVPGTAVELGLATLLGLGFMAIELGLLQRISILVGDPTLALAAVLAVLLVGGGIGSRMAPRLRGRTTLVYMLIAVTAIPLAFTISPLVGLAEAGSATVRAVLAAAIVLPMGLALGAPLPTLLARVARRDDTRIAWIWGANGAASVLGAVVATFIALHAGITACFAVGALCYGLAGIGWWWSERAETARTA
jgi:hypothetical protein